MIARIAVPMTPEAVVHEIESEWSDRYHDAPMDVINRWSQAKRFIIDLEIAWHERQFALSEAGQMLIDEQTEETWNEYHEIWREEVRQDNAAFDEAEYRAEFEVPSGQIVFKDESGLVCGYDDLDYHITRLSASDDPLHQIRAQEIARQLGRQPQLIDGK